MAGGRAAEGTNVRRAARRTGVSRHQRGTKPVRPKPRVSPTLASQARSVSSRSRQRLGDGTTLAVRVMRGVRGHLSLLRKFTHPSDRAASTTLGTAAGS